MTAGTLSAPIAPSDPGTGRRDGFGQLLRAEWTKFRTVRGWVIGMIVAALLTVLMGLFAAANVNIGCDINGQQNSGRGCEPYVPLGPGGEAVQDSFYFIHQPLAGNGTITAQIVSLTGEHVVLTGPQQATDNGPDMTAGLMPWSKAGVMIKENTKRGSAYAAMLITGSHGVRMQYNYTGDVAGMPGAVTASSPRWLRLTRSGDTITGYDSADGSHWTKVGSAHLAGLSSTVQIGLFATSPSYVQTSTSFGGSSNNGGPSQATGTFDHVSVSGSAPANNWTSEAIGGGGPVTGPGSQGGAPTGPLTQPYHPSDGRFTATGSGDIAPLVGDAQGAPTATVEQSLTGAFIGLIAVVVVAAMFFTAEYRRGLIRTTLAATPGRGAVLAAKAIVAGLVAFVAGLVACTVALAVGVPMERGKGEFILPVSTLTEARVVVGTAALLAVAAVFAVAIGAVMRRSAVAVTTVIVAIVLPFLLTVLNVFPSGVANWVMRLTPAAGFAIQQSIPHYSQVLTASNVARGTYPLPPYAGFAVLCCYAAAALGLAFFLLRRRDA